MSIEIRPITEDESEEWHRADSRAFGGHMTDADWAHLAPVVPGRRLGAIDDGRIVGGTASAPADMVVQGGTLPIATVIGVSVQPTHRRQGMLTAMMARQLEDSHERGEPLAGLYASESIIYGRFGYGVGCHLERWTIDRHQTSMARSYETPGRVAFVEPDDARKTFPEVYRRATSDRPGSIERPEHAWRYMIADLEQHRGGRSALFHVAFEREGRIDGYAMYRVKDEQLIVVELMSATDEAYAALWGYCFGVDLRTSMEASHRPVDDPMPWMLGDPRRLHRSVYDGLWIRLVDVSSTLSGRRYARDGRLVLEVSDPFCTWNEGRVELDGGPDGADCRASTAGPDLALSAADLAAAYLGTVSLTTLAQAGRVEERTAGALLRADGMFTTQLAPWCPYSF